MSTVFVTGGHGGIGLECAKQLAQRYRKDLVLAGRSLERMESAARTLRGHGVKVTLLELDTSSLASVRAAAARCRAMLDNNEIAPLQAILCNAGGRFEKIKYTVDGFEETFATNCLGHFLLAELLVDRIQADGRIIFTASGTHDPETIDGKMVGAVVEPDAFALAHTGKDGVKPVSAGKRYTTSKLCNVLEAYELDRRLKASGSSIAAFAFDPGSIPGTGLMRELPKPVQWLFATRAMIWFSKRLGVTIGTAEFSGAALARLAVDPEFSNGAGKYFQSNDGKLIETRSSTLSYDKNRGRKLWDDMRNLAKLGANEGSALLA